MLWSLLPNGCKLVWKSRNTTLLVKFTAQKYIYSFVSKVQAGSFHVFIIHQTLRWTNRIFNVRMRSFLCVRIHTGIGHTDSEPAHFGLWKTHIFVYIHPDKTVTESLGKSWGNWKKAPKRDHFMKFSFYIFAHCRASILWFPYCSQPILTNKWL